MDGNCYLEKWMNYEEEKEKNPSILGPRILGPRILGPHIIFPNITEANEFRKQFGGGIFLTKACYLHNLRGEMFTFEWKKEVVLYDFQKEKFTGRVYFLYFMPAFPAGRRFQVSKRQPFQKLR